MLRRAVLLAAVAVSTGCPSPQPAPKDLDGLARFLFDNFDPKAEDPAISDQELADAVVKMNDVVVNDIRIGDVKLEQPQKGTLANLTAEEVGAVGLDVLEHDPAVPQGMFVVDVIQCDLEELVDIVLTPDQLALYPEAYATYHREFDAGTPEFLPSWVTTYQSSENALVTNQFTATERTGLRRVPSPDNADSGIEPFALDRVFMPGQATFEEPGAAYTDDYQIETYFVRGPRDIVHFYAMWRYMKLGVLGDSYDSIFIDQTTGGMIDWDKKTNELCAQ